MLLAQTRHAEASGLTRNASPRAIIPTKIYERYHQVSPPIVEGLLAFADEHSKTGTPARRTRLPHMRKRHGIVVTKPPPGLLHGCLPSRAASAAPGPLVRIVSRWLAARAARSSACAPDAASNPALRKIACMSSADVRRLDKITPIAWSSGSVKSASGRVLPRSDRLQSRLRSQASSDPLMPPRARCGPRQWFFSSSERRRPPPG